MNKKLKKNKINFGQLCAKKEATARAFISGCTSNQMKLVLNVCVMFKYLDIILGNVLSV